MIGSLNHSCFLEHHSKMMSFLCLRQVPVALQDSRCAYLLSHDVTQLSCTL